MITKRTKRTLLLTSTIILSLLSLTNTNQADAAVGEELRPNWLAMPQAQRKGRPPAYTMTRANPNYNYYVQLTGNGRVPYIFYNTYAHSTNYYTPVASGVNKRYSSIYKPEQLYKNSSKHRLDPARWTNNKYLNARSHLINESKSQHAKSKMIVDNKPGYIRYRVGNSTNKITSGMFAGHNGEWRVLGYSESNGDMNNPIFPSEVVSDSAFTSTGMNLAESRFILDPWLPNKGAAYTFVGGGTRYDKAPKNSADWKIKYNAVQRLIANRPNYRAKGSVEYWMRRYSLQNDPSGGTIASFVASVQGGYYHVSHAPALPKAVKNLALVKQQVVDASGKVIMSVERKPYEAQLRVAQKQTRKIVAGERVYLESVVRNTTPAGSGTTTSSRPRVHQGYKTGSSARTQESYFNANAMDKTFTNTASGNLAAGNSITYRQAIDVPFSSNVMAMYSEIDINHYYGRDNTNLVDDFAQMVLSVNDESGNLINRSIRLVDKSGKEVEHPVPGEQYRLRFYVDYESQSRKFHYVPYKNKDGETYYQYEEYDYYSNNINIDVNYRINRQLPYKGFDGKTGVVTKKIGSMRRGTSTSFNLTTDEYITYETGVFDVDTTISVNKGSSRFNKDASDDKLTQQYRYIYDLNIKNASLIPKTTVHTADGDSVTYLMKFDVNYIVPNHAKNHAKDVTFAVNVGGQTKTVTEHIKGGHNPNVTIEIDVPLEGKDQVVKGIVLANSDSNVYETNYSNNSAKASADVSNVTSVKPYSGAPKNAYSWNQHIQTHEWTSSNRSYKLFNRNTTYNFPFYSPKGTPSNQKIALNEGLKIKHVWFRSKTTQDLKEGPKKDGWVDLTKEVGKIKAGYGYELKIDVGYETDAFSKLPKETTAKWVRPKVANGSIPNNIYVQTPDKKIHSVNGDGGSAKDMKYTRKDASNGGKTDWIYEIAPKKVLGVNTLGKFYIAEDVSNGTYIMTVFTPQTHGLLGKMTSETNTVNNLLFDQKNNLRIEVVGSASDDIDDNITQ